MDSTDLVMLGHFICGMTPTDISRINARQYSRAALAIGRLSLRCTEAQLNSLVKVAMSSSAFGLPSNWGLEVFTEIGSVAVGLPDVVLSALVKEQIEGLTSTAIAIMPPRKFAVSNHKRTFLNVEEKTGEPDPERNTKRPRRDTQTLNIQQASG
ncbi:stereocilin [Lampetra fluviatilis]